MDFKDPDFATGIAVTLNITYEKLQIYTKITKNDHLNFTSFLYSFASDTSSCSLVYTQHG